jgi:hypothetical protein
LKGMKMLRRVLVLLALYCGSAATAFAADPLDEVRRSFTIGGKAIPPEIFADFGDAMMSDSRPIVVTIDANAAIDGNRYADPIKRNGRWVDQVKLGSESFNGPETMSYEFRGATANRMLVFLAQNQLDSKNHDVGLTTINHRLCQRYLRNAEVR